MDRLYIIESPSSEDMYESRCEGKALSEALRLSGADVNYVLAPSYDTFIRAFAFVADDFFKKSGKWTAMPFIHISAHGDKSGIQLTNGDHFDWDDFREALKKINEKIGYVPLVGGKVSQQISRIALGFSTCEGFNAHKIYDGDPCPFQFLVGPTVPVDWSEALTAFQVFYHLANGRSHAFADAVNRMNISVALDDVFKAYYSPELDQNLKEK